MRKLGSVMSAWSARSSASEYEDDRVLERHQPVVHALRDRSPRQRVVHQPTGDIDLAYGAAGPRDHLGRQHGANAELLTGGNEERVDSGGVGRGQLREIANAHQHLGVWKSPPDFGVPFERCHEPEADRLQDRDRSGTFTPQRSSVSSVGSSVSSGPPRSGRTTTRAPVPARSRATSMFDRFTLRTSSAPACTAARISRASKLSTLTRIPSATRSPTTAPSSGNTRPGVQPMSMTSAPESLKYFAA